MTVWGRVGDRGVVTCQYRTIVSFLGLFRPLDKFEQNWNLEEREREREAELWTRQSFLVVRHKIKHVSHPKWLDLSKGVNYIELIRVVPVKERRCPTSL